MALGHYGISFGAAPWATKQEFPARMTRPRPLLCKNGAERGDNGFVPISWDRALEILGRRLENVRNDDPKKFVIFIGRDERTW